MGNRIIFIVVPLSPKWGWMANHIDSVIDIGSTSRLEFKFGSMGRIESVKRRILPIDRIRETIKEHRELFKDEIKIYHGWELVECIHDLILEFPNAEFLIGLCPFDSQKIIDIATYRNANSIKFLERPRREDFVDLFYKKAELQYKILTEFLKNQKLENFNIPDAPSNYKFYYINNPKAPK